MSVTVTRILSPEDWKNRQIGNLTSVGESNYKIGTLHPKNDPIAAGIAAETKYGNAVKKAIDEKRRAKELGKTNMAEWYKYTSEIGAGRLVEGVTKRADKVSKFTSTFQPILVDHVAKIDKLPDTTDGEREAKVLANLKGLRMLKGKA